jgi:uncharacterized membrane protein YkoI
MDIWDDTTKEEIDNLFKADRVIKQKLQLEEYVIKRKLNEEKLREQKSQELANKNARIKEMCIEKINNPKVKNAELERKYGLSSYCVSKYLRNNSHIIGVINSVSCSPFSAD